MIHEDLIYEIIGRRIKEFRDKANFTQEVLAKKTGVSRASIANYESGKQAIYISDLYKIADCLGIGIERILPSLEEIKTKSSPEKLLEKAKNLNRHEKKELKEFIEKYSSREIR